MGISLYDLAKSIAVEPSLLKEIAAGVRPITADTALRLSWHFKLSERFWINLQSRYDSEIASQSNATKISGGITMHTAIKGFYENGELILETERDSQEQGNPVT